MIDRLYPASLGEIESWRIAHGTTLAEARARYAQFVVLECIAASSMQPQLAFKGGNALRFVYQNPRSTIDLDFTASSAFPDDPARIRANLDIALVFAAPRYGVRLRCQRCRRNPPGADKTVPTYDMTVGYLLRGDRHYETFASSTKPVSTIVRVEVSINDVVCQTVECQLDPAVGVAIRACVLEDILAEKLRALLQQRTRKQFRHRKQDVHDIARMLRDHEREIDERKIGDYFLRKCQVRGINPTKASFDNEIRDLAAVDYHTLFDAQDPNFIPFDAAWNEVLALVHRLGIPD